MRERIKQILREVSDLDAELDTVTDLISGRRLDSFTVLMLINNLEAEFKVKFNFGDKLIENLNSLQSIEELLRAKGVKE